LEEENVGFGGKLVSKMLIFVVFKEK